MTSTQLPTDICIRELHYDFEDFLYRAPIKFGGVAVDRVTLLNVHCTVETRAGKVSKGFGSMPLGNVWAFPSRKMSYDSTLDAMKKLTERIAKLTAEYTEFGHPIDLAWALESGYVLAAAKLSDELLLIEPIPVLCTLVTASPFDAAVHDALGKVLGRNCYHTYGSEFLVHDLGHYLGSEFAGLRLDQFVRSAPQPRMPLYHLVGALDPLGESDVDRAIDDGLPETLGDWIRFNG